MGFKARQQALSYRIQQRVTGMNDTKVSWVYVCVLLSCDRTQASLLMVAHTNRCSLCEKLTETKGCHKL